ncbi:GmrSD restriction endonuclease domain-containing protein [Helicobacter muridarum]|nr:DUF1524 domain-containing protein [Helicobacter muridarum]
MDLAPEQQKQIYENCWHTMETEFGENFNKDKKEKQSFDYFVRHYLTIKNDGKTPNLDRIYESFKEYKQSQNLSTKDLLEDLQQYSHFYCTMAFKREKDKELFESFENLKALDCEVAYPFLLELYRDYKDEVLSKNDFLEILKMIESYLLRRAICGIPTNSLNKVFASAMKKVNKSEYLQSIFTYFYCLKNTSKFPNDSEFEENLYSKNIYEAFKKKLYFFDKLENFNRKEKVNINEYTIEHIMPQSIKNSKKWQEELGQHWQEIHEKYLHTLGNLTLTGYNSEYSNKSFREKQNMKGGFKESPLRLNKELKSIESWNEANIKQRAQDLAKDALKIWTYLKLDKGALENYSESHKPKNEQTLENHKFLQNGKSKELFEALRNGILALDEGIEEKILKLYIAYKFDTNFVDIIPQQNALKLSINIYIDELNDPKELAKDVSNIGAWGNGKVEVILDSMDNVAYCLGLIRQALEKQL